ncbi:MAG: AsmA family protein [Rhodospirillum sp.]|nr:AsmA family protein [Rhodospirillum sp.]MCF8490718.1 AsmA family protein [Rhodospirillum sp.]MCF8499383.1 AsmA family protein [Rhodospirillum sp.]
MRNFLIGLGLSLVILVAAVLIVPSFIDWNQYRDQLTAQVQGATGRSLTIEGDLSLSILPTPALAADGVTLANMQGGSDPVMAKVKAVRVNMAIAPLLRGNLVVTSVDIIEPDILLERLADGRVNWEMTAGGSGQGQAEGALPSAKGGDDAGTTVADSGSESGADPAGQGSGGGLSISVDEVNVVDGTLRYRDSQSGQSEDVGDINLVLTAKSLAGPFSARGNLSPRGVPLSLQAAVGIIGQGKATSLALRVAQGDREETPAALEFNGLLSDLASLPILRGDLAVTVADPTALAAALEPAMGAITIPSGPLARPISLKGKIQATPTSGTLRDLVLTGADTEATGILTADLGEIPKLDLSLAFTRIDLNGWVEAAQEGASGGPVKKADLETVLIPSAHAQGTDQAVAPAAVADGLATFALPTGVDLSLDLSADAATFNDSALRDLRVNAVLSGGEVTVNELSSRLPGASDLSAFGFVRNSADGPAIDMTLNANSKDLRALLDWLKVDVGRVPGDRLRALTGQANLSGTAALLKVTGVDLTLDTTRLKGAFTLRPGDRFGIGATLRVGSLNLDAYLPREAPASGGSPATDGETSAATPPSPSKEAADGAVDPTAKPPKVEPRLLAGLEALNDFDASFDLAVERLTLKGEEYAALAAKGTLVNGLLTVTEGGLGEGFGGLRAGISGGVSGFGGVPDLREFSYDLRVADPGRVARTLRVTLPVPAEQLGSVALLGTLSGTPNALTVDSRVIAARADIQAKGRVDGAATGLPTVDLEMALRHPDFVSLVRLVQPDYAPKGAPGAVDIVGHARGGLDQMTLSGLGGTLGKTAIGGTVTVTPGLAVPKVVADLDLGDLVLDDFLPAEKAAFLKEGPPIREAVGRGRGLRPGPSEMVQRAAAVVLAPEGVERRRLVADLASAPWSSDPIDLSALDAVDADVTLKAKSLTHDGWTLGNADIKALARGGVLDLSRLDGELFGGALTGTGKVVGGSDPTYDLDLSLKNLQVARYLSLFGGAAGAQGAGDLSMAVKSQGATVLDIVQALAGNGGVDLQGVDLRVGKLKGQGLAGLFELIGLLNQATSLGLDNGGLADLKGTFSIDQGVVSFDPFSLVSRLYEGAVSGKVDLANWTIDAEGSADIAQSALGGLVGKAIKLPDKIPFSLKGNIDNPIIKVATGSLPKSGGAGSVVDQIAPDAGKALEEVLPGAGSLLNGILGGQSGAADGEAVPKEGDESSKATDEGTKAKEDPAQQLMRGLIKGFGG